MKKLGTILKSLFSNQAAIDCRKNKWYIGLAVFLLSVFLPWIPFLSQGYTSNTASFLTATANQDIDKGIKATFEKDYFKNNITITKNSSGSYCLSYNFTENDYSTSLDDFDKEYIGENSKELFSTTFADESGSDYRTNSTAYTKTYTGIRCTYYYDNISVETSNVIDNNTSSSTTSTSSSVVYEDNGRTTFLENYYFPTLNKSTTNYAQYLNNFITSVILRVGSDNKAQRYPHSYALWGQDFLIFAVYSLKSTTSSLSASGSYSGELTCGFDSSASLEGKTLYNYLTNDGKLSVTEAYKTNFVTLLHTAGRPAYLRSVWTSIGILSAVVVGAILIASLILLFMHKRKTSVYRDVNYFNCLNEAIYMMLCPSIIAMVFSFFNTSMTYVILAGALLMRVIFSMNKICPPPMDNGQGGSKPLYQARD